MDSQRVAVLGACLGLLFLVSVACALPSGPTSINITSNTTKATTAGQMINISGGYVAKVNVTATSQNPHWKAFVGWVQGSFTLDDATGSKVYSWPTAFFGGEIYATRNSSTPSWSTVVCANLTRIAAEDTALEHTGSDNISATFSGVNANAFVTAGQTLAAGACNKTHAYVNNATQSSDFEEVILHDNVSTIIYASILENGVTGYDGGTYDFQLIVPENGNSSKTITTAYYLYVELG